MSDLDECIRTFDQTRAELERVEAKLAIELGLNVKNVRRTLLEMDFLGKLEETLLVADWHQLYASYSDWIESWDDDDEDVEVAEPVRRPPSGRPPLGQRVQEAAEAAFSFCSSLVHCTVGVSWLSIRNSGGTTSASFKGWSKA